MNRGSVWRIARMRRQTYASMRPRFMNRGSVGQSVQTLDVLCGFNEAPIHESGKWRFGSRDTV